MTNASRYPGKEAPPGKTNCKEAGLVTEDVKLAKPDSAQKWHEKAEGQCLLPHERDETTGAVATGNSNETGRGRAVMGQAADDIERGLEDTDCRGIPSDIFGLGHCSSPSTAETKDPGKNGGDNPVGDKDEKAGKTP
ncbi:hypothetical protein [Nitrosospira sp. Nsp1]|uniref:hypothetical protein n=1 Tax=Nitrosospira sp. Nsp1 TaxID=136547 RepID=UPI00087E84CE|nr:hypothetical protein [Nitrosospira sp. Nsp1]SCX56481.1 hypothetical protein SAMN05720354_11755 [Nitrosospira sp. Nsp1]